MNIQNYKIDTIPEPAKPNLLSLEFKLIAPKSISGTYFHTKLNMFGFAGLPIGYLRILNVHILAVWRATGLKF